MPEIKIIETEIKGEVYINTDSQYNNLKADKVIVDGNIIVRLFGFINELLVIKEGAKVYLHGTVNGEIENNGELFTYN